VAGLACGRSGIAPDAEREHEMAEKSESSVGTAELADQVKAIRADINQIVETLKSMGAERVERASETIRSAVQGAGDTVRHTAEEARHRGEEAASEMEAAIRRNPVTALLIALGLGFLVGSLSRR
jgi:ElaB/YqjD/DUF883 family membrane-anchored ribosome-binding protein